MKAGPLSILSFDPGGTTGWALYQCTLMPNPSTKGDVYEHINERWDQGEMGPGAHHLQMWDFMGQCHAGNYIIVCESFEFRQEARDNVVLVSREYIGLVNLYEQMCRRTLAAEVRPVVRFQTAASGKGFWYPKAPGTQKRDATKLKKLGLYTPGSTHINDATSHLLHYLTYGDMRRMEWLKKLNEEST